MAKKKKAEKPPHEMTRRQLSHFKRQKRRQRIIFIGGVSVIATVILIVLAGWIVKEYLPLHTNIIVVNDTKYKTSYLIDFLKIASANQPSENIQKLVDSAVNEIIQEELIRQGAEGFGITVSDEDAQKIVADAGLPESDASVNLARAQLLRERLNNEHFGPLVPVSDNQVHMLAMLVESERTAVAVRDRLLNSENFTALAEEFALNYYSKNVNKGDFGWHPQVILAEQLGSSIPIDFAFGAEVGALSQPLRDEESYKQRGYWLLRVNERPAENTANVSALYLSSEQEAEGIRDRLEAGDNLTALADEYSQYSLSKEQHGELGLVPQSDNISGAFNGYVFNPKTELGKWSAPILEENYWTQGGYWLVKVVDKENDRKLSDEDRSNLIDTAYSDWVSMLWAESADTVGSQGLTPELRQRAVDEVLKGQK